MGSLSRADLIKLVCSGSVEWEAAERCCERLRKSSALKIPGKPVKKSHIERIYTVRLSRPDSPRDVIGSDRLLDDLATHPGDELTMVVLSGEGDPYIYAIFLDERATKLVTCFVAPDRRLIAE
jgi:hypothetical protein